MRRFPLATAFALAALLISATLPARAQHGGAHGGGGVSHSGGSSGHFSAPSSGFHSSPAPHISSGFRGGFNSPTSRFNGSSSNFRPYRPGMPANLRSPGYRNPYSTRPAYPIQGHGNDRFRQPYRGNGGDRDRDHRRYGFGYWNSPYAIPYLYPYSGWLDSGFYDDSADNGSYDNYVTNQPYPDSDYDQGYSNPQDSDQDYDQSAPPSPGAYARPPYSPRPEYDSAPLPTPPSVTLVFKDGRPSQQIHNYMLSRNTLTVLDQGRHDIPVDQLDLAATEKANRETGVDFHLPSAE